MTTPDPAACYLLCVNNDGYPASLEVRKVYRALPDPVAASRGFVRVVDESGEDYLYRSELFVGVELPQAAVRVGTGAASGPISPTLNVVAVNLFLEQFGRELAAGVHAALVWDGAGYHTSDGPVVPSNVSLIRLVPYSPELNPVENLWHHLRSHHRSLRVYRDYEALEVAAMAAWRTVCLEPGAVRSICAAPCVSNHA